MLQLKGPVQQIERTVGELIQDSERTVSVRTQLVSVRTQLEAGRRVERQPMEAESTVTLSLLGRELLEMRMDRRQHTYL